MCNYLGDHMRKCSNIMTNVYRHRYTFLPYREVAPAYSSSDNVPPFFRNPRMIDVTAEYWPVTDISLKDLEDVKGETPFVYLTVFDNKGWNAVAWAENKDGNALFTNVTVRTAVYLPAYYIGGEYVPASSPICVRADSTIVTLRPDTASRQTVRLARKYYEMRVRIFMLGFVGSTLQVANKADFSDARQFVVPDTIGTAYQDWHVDGSYRYVRFIPKRGADCGLAELAAYDTKGQKIDARVVGRIAAEPPYAKENIEDDDELTYTRFSKKDTTEWVGLNLKRKTHIAKVSYLTRNDGNFIVDGNDYELFYWDGRWVSLGHKVGSRETQELVYTNVPQDPLLLLRNHT